MERVIVLEFKRPCSDDYEITPNGGEFGAPRWYGGHKGVDFKVSWGHKVFASERGKVVFSGMREGTKDETKYGNVIVVDHTFEARCKGRYLYTLYAHLSKRKGRKGQIVEKGEVVGTAGNSGTREYYRAKKNDGTEGGYHLHFEMIDSPRKLYWRAGNWYSVSLRKNPFKGYIESTITLDCEELEVMPGNVTRFGDSLKSRPFGRRFNL